MRTLLVPLQLDSAGRWATTADPAVILAQQITDILVTNWYDRVMLPEHGADLQSFLFAPILSATLSAKADEIKTILSAKISFGEILKVSLEPVANAVSTVKVSVAYRVIETAPTQTVFRTFSGLVDEETSL
jgi:phage baseplate assembly protein W